VTQERLMIVAATVCTAIGLWLMLPRGGHRGRRLGILLGLVGLGLYFWQFLGTSPSGAGVATQCVFVPLAALTVIACAASVTARNPVYTAVWFGVALLGTAGLFMLQSAQFLSVATVVVYAGAILVTFLFVLMLAQPEGHAYYDRLSWEAMLSAVTGAVVLGVLVTLITSAMSDTATSSNEQPVAATSTNTADGAAVADRARATDTTAGSASDDGAGHKAKLLDEAHVARFGGQLFGPQLVAVEVGGTLLLAALVGAVAIVMQGRAALDDQASAAGDGRPRHA